MTQEEKARAYDEAIQRAKEYLTPDTPECVDTLGVITNIFPELAESEDKKVRREIISALKFANYDGVYDKHIAWLEKQKDAEDAYELGYTEGMRVKNEEWLEKQNHAWSEEDDIMVHDIDYALRCQITYPISKLQSMSIWINNLKDKVKPQQSQKWSKNDEYYNGIILYCLDGVKVGEIDKENAINWFKSLKERIKGEQNYDLGMSL